MRRGIFIGILLIFLNLAFVSGISGDFKNTYLPEENMISEIKGNILEPIIAQDVVFKRGHVEVPIEYDLKNLGGKYYLWAKAPRNPNNYSVVIENIGTTENGRVVEVDYEFNFSVEGDLVEYTINPGFIYTNKDFEVSVFLNRDEEKEIEVDFTSSDNVLLNPGSNTLDFSIDGVGEAQLLELSIGDYTMPAYIIKEGNAVGEKELNLRFNPKIINSKVVEGKVPEYPFSIVNFGGSDAKDIILEYNEELFDVMPEGNINVSSGDEIIFVLSFKEEIGNKVDEKIIAKIGNNSIEMDVLISIVEDLEEEETPYLESNKQESQNYYCNEIAGTICGAGEICEGEEQSTLDGTCCLGICKSKRNWTGVIIGTVIFAGIIGLGYFIFKKYKGAGKIGDIIKDKLGNDKQIGVIDKKENGLP